jgi:hypothetical protein
MWKPRGVVLLLCVMVGGPAARGTTFARMSVEEMVAAADAVVHARCLGTDTRREAGELWTFASFEVEETWKGVAPRLISVRLLGGRLGNLTYRVEGVPEFRTGEEVVLFLQRTRAGDFAITSWVQGTFRVRRDSEASGPLVMQDSSSMALFDPATQRFRQDGERRAPLKEFRARVRELVGKQQYRKKP